MFRTWGILALHLEDFKLVSNVHESLGFESNAGILKPVTSRPPDTNQGLYFDATPPPRLSMRLSVCLSA